MLRPGLNDPRADKWDQVGSADPPPGGGVMGSGSREMGKGNIAGNLENCHLWKSLPPTSLSLTALSCVKKEKKKSFKYQLKFSLEMLTEAELREGQMLFFSQLR